MSIMNVDNFKAKIEFNPETEEFRGEILGLSGGADFYGKTVPELKREFRKSLKIYLDTCKEEDIEPFKSYSGKFVIRIDPNIHEKISVAAANEDQTLNTWVTKTLKEAVR